MLKLRFTLNLFAILVLLSSVAYAQEATKEHKDSLNSIVQKYYDLNVKVFQANSTVDDIDHVFDLFTEDFTYVHPKYGGTYSRQDLYDGYVRNQQNGAYNGSITGIKIDNQITGLNAVVTEKRFIERTEIGAKEGNPEMTLFEFKEGKISRIYEYW